MEWGRFDPQDELRRYLESSLAEGVTNVVHYWGSVNFDSVRLKAC